MILQVLEVFGLGVLGILFYAVFSVQKKIKKDGFSPRKFFVENKRFWIWGIILHMFISVFSVVIPDIVDLLHTLGFAIEEDSAGGWILLGVALATGTDKTSLSGSKKLNNHIND